MYGKIYERRWIFAILRYFANVYQTSCSLMDKRYYATGFEIKIILIAIKYRHLYSFKVVSAEIKCYYHKHRQGNIRSSVLKNTCKVK